ncbi:MAG: hypothetical protein HYX69_16290 [Planctomycetia bacterium]|nr:hypothetical protein [Planctomycetia bacterium]
MRDDAELAAVSFVDGAQGWAVGDRGIIWHTADGGQSWQLQESGVDARLESVHFVDGQAGWIGGGFQRPYVRGTSGVLLRTGDGGHTWGADQSLLVPAVKYVRFFGAAQGWVVAEPSPLFPTGILHTGDAGRTWTPLAGRTVTAWGVADFHDPLAGAVAGPHGARASVRERGLDEWQQPEFGLREPRAMRITSASDGWMVGDGGLVLTTRDGGRSWRPPQTPLVADDFDFRAVAARGRRSWIAGSPGSRVFASPDGGETWESFPTGQSLPLNALAFADDEHGWAVGALGTILATVDGGRTWQRQRGPRQRAAMLAFFGDAHDVPVEAFAHWVAGEGYVGAVEFLARRDVEPGTESAAALTASRRAALTALGFSAVEAAWGFPLRQDGLRATAEQIVDGWNRAHAGQGIEQLEAHLVRQIRTYRPEVVLTSAAGAGGDNPLANLIHQAVGRAVAAAGDASKFPEQIADAGLEPWTVKKRAANLPAGQLGAINSNTSQLAPRLMQSLSQYAAAARGQLFQGYRPPPANWGFRVLLDSREEASGQQDLFSGMSLPFGSEARRELAAAPRAELDAVRQIADKHRNFQAIVAHSKRSGRGGAVLLAQVGDLTRGLDAPTAGQALFELGQTYYAEGQWDMAAEMFRLLCEKYPGHALVVPSYVWLVQYWSSGEAACRASRDGSVPVVPASAPAAESPPQPMPARGIPAANQVTQTSFAATSASAGPAAGGEPRGLAARRAKADAFAEVLQRSDALAFSGLNVQFPLVAGEGRGKGRAASRFTSAMDHTRPHDAWWACARGEHWLQESSGPAPPKSVFVVARAASKPRLDGRLDDDVWQQANREELRSALADDSQWPAAAMMAYDDEFLYVAVACRCASGAAYPAADGVRPRDADLAAQDRVELLIDIDRDWTTFYRLAVDHRGWAAEDCWGDAAWNPRWFVAAIRGENDWTVEAAIPLAELSIERVAPKTVWALGLQRIVPEVGFQSWTRPAAITPIPEGFGYLIFD